MEISICGIGKSKENFFPLSDASIGFQTQIEVNSTSKFNSEFNRFTINNLHNNQFISLYPVLNN